MSTLAGQKVDAKSGKKKSRLLEMEKQMHDVWEKEKIYEANAPAHYDEATRSKFFTTFPYPYMNGRMHLGHAFSLTKNEFRNRYMRLCGKNSLFPFGFHCTGMPIVAAANKLKKELADPSLPKNQTKILESMGIPASEIPDFADAQHWLKYFPPRAQQDLRDMGISVDWRRSFITTEVNPYYDSFVRWQFNTLKARGKLSFGKRHTVYCATDKQPCADHDRQSGEGIMPQEYTLIKLQILDPFPEVLKALKDEKVFLVAATLRPETMYGQTNCFVLPDGEYGVYKMKSGEYFVCSERSAKNMAYQDLTPVEGKYEAAFKVKGKDLIGVPLKAPLAQYERVYTLPMLNISMKKGTGVVTSCPSDAPDDWATLKDLQKKKELRAKFGVKDEWVLSFQAVPIISTPSFGDMAAKTLCETMKINSQNDTEKLRQAKDQAYLKGFSEGVMTVGMCKGEKVAVAKNKVRKYMIDNGMAVGYWEPQEQVISRSGEECIVALCDQWCENYGEQSWKEKVMAHVKSANFTCYNETCRKCFVETLDWLREWACSRVFGLGTRIPWDKQFLIESLSDSTIYNAFYTVAHLLQGGVLNGSVPGPLGIQAKDMTDAEWDYVFLAKPYPAGSKVEEAKLKQMRHEFEYWYPVDLRCSAKDLIKNHLTMMLYNHQAIWQNDKMMPRSFFCNGYVLVNGRKMSKQEGNFYTLRDVLDMFGSDATRLALASAGDLLEDANIQIEEMNQGILKIYTLQKWIEKQLSLLPDAPLPAESPESLDLFDKIFKNDMIEILEETRNAYETMRFRDVVKNGFFEFQGAKDDYMVFKKLSKVSWRALLQYIEWQLIIMAPIIPHTADFCWRHLLLPKLRAMGEGKDLPESVVNAKFPVSSQKHDKMLGRISSYLRGLKREIRLGIDKATSGKKGGKGKKEAKKGKEEKKAEAKKVEAKKETEEQKKPAEEVKKLRKKSGKKDTPVVPKFSKCVVVVAKNYNEVQNKVLVALNSMQLNEKNELVGDLIGTLRPMFDKKALSGAMKFANFCVERAKEVGKDAFETAMPFDEKDLVAKNTQFLVLDVAVGNIDVVEVNDSCPYDQFKAAKAKATPGHPEMFFLP